MTRVAIVSGGGTGIGRAIAAGLAADGFEVVIVGRRAQVLQETAKQLNADLDVDRVVWRSADLADVDAVQALTDGLRADYGTIDAIVNNAGGGWREASSTLAEVARAWRAMYEQNVLSAVLLTEGLLPALRRPGGRIVLIGSMTSRTGGGGAAYGAAKAALNGWVLALSGEHAGAGVTANVILPGYVPDTELNGTNPFPVELHNRIVSRIAAGRPGKPEDTAALTRFLVSEGAGFVTGQVIEVNGGILPSNK
ncbi:SDR family NAD(P)-dependent oxidoreductase [Jatrophihabitans sp. DSM 45814]